MTALSTLAPLGGIMAILLFGAVLSMFYFMGNAEKRGQ
jgi:hypothetical protein